MAKNESLTSGKKLYTERDKGCCSNCGGSLEPVGNRFFLMYKRAHLPQPSNEAFICQHCGWVEGDDCFKALLEDRLNHR